jgi:hypothetical protein
VMAAAAAKQEPSSLKKVIGSWVGKDGHAATAQVRRQGSAMRLLLPRTTSDGRDNV